MPSLINELIFDEVKSIVDESESLLLIDPAGLKADESLALRRQLSGIGAHEGRQASCGSPRCQ